MVPLFSRSRNFLVTLFVGSGDLNRACTWRRVSTGFSRQTASKINHQPSRKVTFHRQPHSRPQSLLGAWARGPEGSGDTGFEVLDFRTSGHFWSSTTFVIEFTCCYRSVNECNFRWFKAFKRESSNLLLNRKWPKVLKSRTSNPVSPETPGPSSQAPGGSGDENASTAKKAVRFRKINRQKVFRYFKSHYFSWSARGFWLLKNL